MKICFLPGLVMDRRFRKIAAVLLLKALLCLPSAAFAKPYSIQFFGDFFLPEWVVKSTKTSLEDPQIFADIASELAKGDLNVVNLEGAITGSDYRYPFKDFYLKMPLMVAPLLHRANIHVATLANNHSMDYGRFGLFDTLASLGRNEIAALGAGFNAEHAARPLSLATPKGQVCLIALSRSLPEDFWAEQATPGTAHLSFENTAKAIRSCSKTHAHTFVLFHWGEENKKTSKAYQRELARLAIDSGATGVIGHHPHVIQEVEFYKGGFIVYSMGNFIFGTNPGKSLAEGLLVRAMIDSSEGIKLQLVGLNVDNHEVKFKTTKLEEKFALVFIGSPGKNPCTWISSQSFWECPLHPMRELD
jgi:poly-gamma-glutamate synthesis protein (capsule biosynthesis protein)